MSVHQVWYILRVCARKKYVLRETSEWYRDGLWTRYTLPACAFCTCMREAAVARLARRFRHQVRSHCFKQDAVCIHLQTVRGVVLVRFPKSILLTWETAKRAEEDTKKGVRQHNLGAQTIPAHILPRLLCRVYYILNQAIPGGGYVYPFLEIPFPRTRVPRKYSFPVPAQACPLNKSNQ